MSVSTANHHYGTRESYRAVLFVLMVSGRGHRGGAWRPLARDPTTHVDIDQSTIAKLSIEPVSGLNQSDARVARRRG
jgi:hypothetical protein